MNRAGADPWEESGGFCCSLECSLSTGGAGRVCPAGDPAAEKNPKKTHLFELKTNKFNIRGLRIPWLGSAMA